jgi:hypothetical protein
MAQPRAALRQLLRAIDVTLPRENGSSEWREFVLNEFRKKVDAEGAAKGFKLMQDSATLITAIKHQRVGTWTLALHLSEICEKYLMYGGTFIML